MKGVARSGRRWNRRELIQWVAVVAALHRGVATPAALARGTADGSATAVGYGGDPPLNPPRPAAWPRRLGRAERRAAAWLLDQLLPGHDALPAASEVGLVEFLDEWVSAPYPAHVEDRVAIEPLLRACARCVNDEPSVARVWLRAQADPMAPHGAAFERVRVLAAAAYYTTPAGIEAIGFVGNTPRDRFDGPPPDVLQKFDADLQNLAVLGSEAPSGSARRGTPDAGRRVCRPS